MGQAPPFADVLDAVDRLSTEEQETLLEIVQRRMAERRRTRLAAEVKEARAEFARGDCTETSPDVLLTEALS
jgi:hypothetical protein